MVPEVVNQVSADDKHTALTEGIYKYFVTACGTNSEGKGHKRQQKIAKQVREAKVKKKACKEVLMRRRKPVSL